MRIYVSDNVTLKKRQYSNFLMRVCGYFKNEADTKVWEIEQQIIRRCNPLLMQPHTSGTIKFKSVLQRQEIQRLSGNLPQLSKIINRRKGNNSNTQWKADYSVSANGDVFILTLECYNSYSEERVAEPDKISLMEQNSITNKFRHINNKKVVRLTESDLHRIVKESVNRVLRRLA